VWRLGDAVVKRFDPRRGLARRLRSAPALSCARSCARIAPLRTPRPWLAFVAEDDTSWLVTEFVAGKHLHAAFASDPAAADALPAFMAEMHRHGVIHGDLNVWNLLWDGHAWVLIDLEGLRGPLHRLRARAIGDDQWVRFGAAIRDLPRIAELFGRYLALLGEQHTQSARWPPIERRASELVRHYDRLIRESGERAPAG
jgi:hypothetical protein